MRVAARSVSAIAKRKRARGMADSINHVQSTVGRVVALRILGIDVDSEKLGTQKTLDAGKVGLAVFVGSGNIVAVNGLRWDIVMSIDKDCIACNASDLGIGDRFMRGFDCAATESAVAVKKRRK